LPSPDRGPITRALHPDPGRRFASCGELIDALARGAAAKPPPTRIVLPPLLAVPGQSPAVPVTPLPQPSEVIGHLLEQAPGPLQLHQADGFNYLLQPGALLKHTATAFVSARLARLKVEAFRQQWNADLLHDREGTFVLRVPLGGSFWQRCFGPLPALELHLRLPPNGTTEELTALHLTIRPVRCQPEQAAAALVVHGPPLLHSLRTIFQVEADRRAPGRLPYEHAVGVFPVGDDRQLGEALVCHGKDVSAGGIGFFAPQRLPAEQLYVQSLLTPQFAGLALLGRVVRERPCGDGRYEVGVAFAQGPGTLDRPRRGLPTVRFEG
jgi:hypothetical protein